VSVEDQISMSNWSRQVKQKARTRYGSIYLWVEIFQGINNIGSNSKIYL
jgi:hypothetical protein